MTAARIVEALREGARGARAVVAATMALACLPAGAAAQQARLTVCVQSEEAPVAGAEVTAGTLRALTDDGGAARLQLVAGEHDVRVTSLGHAPAELRVVLAAGADTTVVVSLEVEALETEPILVLSTRTERRIEDVPLRVEVVSREEVEEKLLMTPGDIAMLLNETAGLRMQPTAPSLGGASVRIQGLRGRYTQILADGLPLYGGQAGALGPLQIPPMDLGQVEVIKGAASALYGATALGGVVNLISRGPDPSREELLNQTTLGGTDAVAWLADEPGERWGYTLLGSLHRQGRADVDDDGWADLPGYRRAVVRPRLFRTGAGGGSLFLTVGLMAEDREGGTLPGRTTPAGTSFAEELTTRRLDAGVVGRRVLSGSTLLTVRASAMGQRHRHEFGPALERDAHATAFVEGSLAGLGGAHAWVLGAALQHERYDGRDVSAFDLRYTVPALFAQDEYAPADWLTDALCERAPRSAQRIRHVRESTPVGFGATRRVDDSRVGRVRVFRAVALHRRDGGSGPRTPESIRTARGRARPERHARRRAQRRGARGERDALRLADPRRARGRRGWRRDAVDEQRGRPRAHLGHRAARAARAWSDTPDCDARLHALDRADPGRRRTTGSATHAAAYGRRPRRLGE
ncbi:MAG: TonB-dependent receptor [Gemmatimonadetes bacterium]|nr:TonB-dependent receptor [Gemmatimonadota bacterium]